VTTNPLISIIVPIYNIGKYLPRCIDSILSQTHENLEIILINDGSTDNSGEICDEYASKDTRIIVKHQENAGVSTARNVGLEIAKGEWIGFVDADDWVEPAMFEKLLNAALTNNTQLSFCNYIKHHESGKTKSRIHSKTPETLTRDQMLALVLHLDYRFCVYCCYLYHHTIFKTTTAEPVRFDPKIHYGEDRLMLLQAVIRANGTAYIPDILYNYYQRKGSAVYTVNDKRITFFAALKQMIKHVEPISPSLVTKAQAFLIIRTVRLIGYSCLVKRYKDVKMIRREAKKFVLPSLMKKELDFGRKARMLAALYLPKSIVGAIGRKSKRYMKEMLVLEED